jgi:hypothetical protein
MENNLDNIIKLTAFNNVFSKLFSIDAVYAQNIYDTLNSTVKETHSVLANKNISKSEKEVALLREINHIQALLNQYLHAISSLSNKREGLWKAAGSINQDFFDNIFNSLDLYFENINKLMADEIEKEMTWCTGMKDVFKKSSIIVNKASDGINLVAKKVNNKELIHKELDDSSFMEKLLEKYLNKDHIQKHITSVFEKCINLYNEEWKSSIQEVLTGLEDIKVFELPGQKVQLPFQLGSSEQVVFMGIGSALAGTLGLAAGWHTLTYAMINVFPPIAAFALAAGAVTGILTKEKSIENNKKQAAEAVNDYYRYIIISIEKTVFKELGNTTFRKYISACSNEVIEGAILNYEKAVLGNLTVENYMELHSAFQKHLMLLNEELES